MASKSGEAPSTKGWWHRTCIISKRLDGKTAVVTGANTGIGAITAAELARRGCIVIMGCRDMGRAKAAKDKIISQFGEGNPDNLKTNVADPVIVPSLSVVKPEQLILEQIDLGSLDSVRQFAQRVNKDHPKLNFLINNAGLALSSYETTTDGFEKTMGVNYLGPFLLTELLLPALKQGAPSRIINVASMVHNWGKLEKPDLQISKERYVGGDAYYNSKLANVMHARELAKRLAGTGVIAVSLHPGIIKSEFFRDHTTLKMRMQHAFITPLAITPWLGAQTTLYAVLADNLESGAYYDNCALKSPKPTVLNEEECKWLWEKSCELVGLKDQAA